MNTGVKVECAAHLPSVTRTNPSFYAIVMSPVDLVLFRMCSPEGGVAGAGDEGNKQLIERDKVDIELRVCVLVMNASNKMCLCGDVEEEPYTHDAEGRGRVLLVWLISSLACLCEDM